MNIPTNESLNKDVLFKMLSRARVHVKPYIIYRFEPYIDEGTLFIYNKKSKKIYVGDYCTYLVIDTASKSDPVVFKIYELIEQRCNASMEELIELLLELKEKDIIDIKVEA